LQTRPILWSSILTLGLRWWKRIMIQVREVINKDEKSSLAADILTDLPEWFGIHESSNLY
jgi:hypothetical protein